MFLLESVRWLSSETPKQSNHRRAVSSTASEAETLPSARHWEAAQGKDESGRAALECTLRARLGRNAAGLPKKRSQPAATHLVLGRWGTGAQLPSGT